MPEAIHDRVGHLGLLASAAAFSEGEDWLDELRDYLAETRRVLPGLLAEHAPGVRVAPSQATFLAWLDFRDAGLGDDPAATVLERGRLSLLRGTDFGSVGKGFARLNIGTSRELVEESVQPNRTLPRLSRHVQGQSLDMSVSGACRPTRGAP